METHTPSFWELRKNIDQLINEGYFRDVLKLNVKSKTRSGVKFNFGGEEYFRDKDVLGFLEAIYEFKEYGVVFKENWNTDNILTTELNVENWIRGTSWSCLTTLYPDKWPRDDSFESTASTSGRRKWNYGDKLLKLEALYRNDSGSLSLSSTFSASKVPNTMEVGPVVKGGALLNWSGIMIGCGIGADVGAAAMLDCVVGAHLEKGDVIVNGFLTNAKVVSASISQKFFDDTLEVGATGRWSLDNEEIREMRVACRCNVDEDMTVRFKFDNFKYMGVGLVQRFRKGVKLFVSFMANGMHLLNGNLYEDCHFGACLELDGDDS